MLRTLLSIGLLSLLSLASAQHGGAFKARRHHERAAAVQQRSDLTERDSYSGRATWFIVGLGACGQWSNPGDFMVALNTPQYGDGYPGPNCFRSITIQYNGETQVATILDECPSCNYGDLDMSQGLFDSFATPDVGEFQMTWWFNDGDDSGGGGQQTTSTPWSDPAPWTTDQPSSTSQWVDPAPWTTDQPTSTSQWVDPAPWTTDQPSSTSTSTTSTSTTSTSSSSSSSSSSSVSGVSLGGTPTTMNLAGPEQTGTANDPTVDNFGAMGQLLVNLGGIIVAGSSD